MSNIDPLSSRMPGPIQSPSDVQKGNEHSQLNKLAAIGTLLLQNGLASIHIQK